jgi:hypothetical protein
VTRQLDPRDQQHRPLLLAAFTVPVVMAVLTACGGSSSGGSGGTTAPTGASSSAASGNGTPAAGEAASGQVAAISGTTMQVQNAQSGQVAVAWTATTDFTHTVTTSLAAVRAGQCVTAVAPSGTSQSASSFTATTLMVSKPVDGSCAGRAGGAGGQRPSGLPTGTNLPPGFPTGGTLPSGFPTGAGGGDFGAFVSGKVTSVTGSTVVVAARTFGSSSTATTNKTITAGAKTVVTTEASTTAASVKVGLCVTAQGKADSTGTVAARSVRISKPANGQCLGFGGPGQGNR